MAVTDVATADELDSKIAGIKLEVDRVVGDAVSVLRGEIRATERRLSERIDNLDTKFGELLSMVRQITEQQSRLIDLVQPSDD